MFFLNILNCLLSLPVSRNFPFSALLNCSIGCLLIVCNNEIFVMKLQICFLFFVVDTMLLFCMQHFLELNCMAFSCRCVTTTCSFECFWVPCTARVHFCRYCLWSSKWNALMLDFARWETSINDKRKKSVRQVNSRGRILLLPFYVCITWLQMKATVNGLVALWCAFDKSVQYACSRCKTGQSSPQKFCLKSLGQIMKLINCKMRSA